MTKSLELYLLEAQHLLARKDPSFSARTRRHGKLILEQNDYVVHYVLNNFFLPSSRLGEYNYLQSKKEAELNC